MKVTKEQKEKVLRLFERAVAAQAVRWDAEREIEKILECEVEWEKEIKWVASSLLTRNGMDEYIIAQNQEDHAERLKCISELIEEL